MTPRDSRRGPRRPALGAALLLVVSVVVAACGETVPRAAEDVRADALWEQLLAAPSVELVRAFEHENNLAARKHGEMHDRAGIRYKLRAMECRVIFAEHAPDRSEAENAAHDIADHVAELDRGDLLRLYDEIEPGSAAKFRALAERAAVVTR